MSWQILRPQLKTLLETVTTLQEVSASPKIKFSGYPAAHIMPSDNSADYDTNKENVRTYAFKVRVFYETKHTELEDALTALEEVVDSVLDKFDEEDMKTDRTVGVSLPSGYHYVNIWAAPSTWGEIVDEQLIVAEISVRVRLIIDVS